MVDGAAGLAIIIAAVVISIGILPAIFLRERFTPDPADTKPRKNTINKNISSRRG